MSIPNGIPAKDLPGKVIWQKSPRSNPSGNCAEMAKLEDGNVGVRNSRDPQGPVLVFTPEEISAWIGGAKDGSFDAYGG